MFENLKIRNRLGKAFRIIVTTCSIAAVLGVVMLIVTMTLYKNALNNYGFSQGDIGKAWLPLPIPDLPPVLLSDMMMTV